MRKRLPTKAGYHHGDLRRALLVAAVKLIEEKAATKEVIRALGPHPKSGEELNILAGRYGPYVTDGKANASLRKGMEIETLTMDEAVSLIAQAHARKKSKSKRGGRR